jgi:hypothetical protein
MPPPNPRRSAARRRRAVALAIVALGAVLVAVTASRGGHRTPAAWHVPASAPLSVSAENRLPGTTSWRLPAGGGRSPIAAYVSEQTATPGDTERVYADDPGAAWLQAAVYRIGWYGGRGGRLEDETGRLRPRPQPPCHHVDATGLTECRWHPLVSLRLPRSLTSGVYVVKLSDASGNQHDAMFVLTAARPAPMLVQIPIATYEAYNNWGGDSLYPGYHRVGVTGTKQGVEVSFDRPYDSTTGAGQFFKFDVAMVRFLERRGYPLSYTTGVGVDQRPDQLEGRRAVLDVGHSEYWSERDEAAFAAALAHGANLAFLSSDTMAWRVRFEPATRASSEAGRPDHVMIGYKEHAALDPDRAAPSGAFPDNGASITGSAFENCITPPAGTGRYRYYAWRPSPTLTPSWLYRGTGLTPSSSISGIVGYELDKTTAATPAGTLVVGGGTATCRSPAAPDRADTTLYRARSGARVFATGTLGWQFGLDPLPSVSPDVPRAPDPRLERLTDNVLRTFLGT